MQLAYFKSIFIHPDNETYPIFSIQVKKTEVDFFKKCDYSQINVNVQNLQLFDTTCYPDTLSPRKEYFYEDKMIETEILGLNKELGVQNMLEMTLYIFDFPSETRCEV